MARVIAFPRRFYDLVLQSLLSHWASCEPSFGVHVEPVEDGWEVVARRHAWFHSTLRDALNEARHLARGFNVPVVIWLWRST